MTGFWIDFVFGALQNVLAASIKNPASDNSKKVGVWLDRIDGLIHALKTRLNEVK
jgi:hypothetical protein